MVKAPAAGAGATGVGEEGAREDMSKSRSSEEPEEVVAVELDACDVCDNECDEERDREAMKVASCCVRAKI